MSNIHISVICWLAGFTQSEIPSSGSAGLEQVLGYSVSVGLLCFCWNILFLLGYSVSDELFSFCWIILFLLDYSLSVGLFCFC